VVEEHWSRVIRQVSEAFYEQFLDCCDSHPSYIRVLVVILQTDALGQQSALVQLMVGYGLSF
jgi:hypothetical protein